MPNVLPSPYVSPQSESVLPTRGIRWVLGVAFALLAIAAWLVILIQLALVVRAELRLQQIVAQASEFALLPQVKPNELHAFVGKRVSDANFHHAKAVVGPSLDGHRVLSISIPATQALPAWMRPLAVGLDGKTVESTLLPPQRRWLQ